MRRLLIRPGAIGDLIVSLPALEFLRAEYTEVWVAGHNVPLVRFADRVRPIASTGLDLVGLGDLGAPGLTELEAFDSVVSWYGTNRPEFRDAVVHLPFQFFPALPEGGSHAVDFYMRQAGGPGGVMPRIACPAADGGFVAIHPFSGSPRKNWPLEKFHELAAQLPLPVRFCAGPEEALEGAVQFDDLYDLACWLASARAYIGNDSGVSHLAAAVGTPVVALFGSTDPLVWSPRSPSVRVVHRARMEDIRVPDVLRAVLTLAAGRE